MSRRYRRPVVVGVVDVVDSVGWYQRLGDRRAHELIDAALDRAARYIRRTGGRDVKHQGDALLFEHPDPDGAFHAVHAVQQTTGRVTFRIGAHRGPVIRRRRDLFGDTVNVAARLSAIARPGQIIISDALQQELCASSRDHTRWLDELRLRGTRLSIGIFEGWWASTGVTVANTVLPRAIECQGELVLKVKEQALRIGPHDEVTVGRAGGCTVIVPGERISRLHAVVEYNRGNFVVRDLSTNGTYVQEDGHSRAVHLRREELPLRSRGRIRLGRPFSGRADPSTFAYEFHD